MSATHIPRMFGWFHLPAIYLSITALLLILNIGCTQEHAHILSPQKQEMGNWQPWHVIETQTGQILSSTDLMKKLASYEVVYLGEEHHNQYHIEAALQILEQLSSDGFQPVIGMEMFGWDGQPALDSYVSQSPLSRSEFLDQVRWTQNWGGAFEDYEPLVSYARNRGLSVRAMNPPKPLIRQIVKAGLAKVREEPEWTQWGMHQEEIIDDPTYHARIVDQIQRCHGGGSEDHFRTMYEASMVRDEGMAKTLAAELNKQRQNTSESRSIIVSYTGGGHIQFSLPVPMRVARRVTPPIKYTTVYMTSFDTSRLDDIRESVHERIADYIWLTPMGKKGPPQRCR